MPELASAVPRSRPVVIVQQRACAAVLSNWQLVCPTLRGCVMRRDTEM